MKYNTITKKYAIGFMVTTYAYAGGDREPDIATDIAFFPEKDDAERWLAENGFTRRAPQFNYWGYGWRGPNSYINAEIRKVSLEMS